MYDKYPYTTIEELRAALRREFERAVAEDDVLDEIIEDVASIVWTRLGRDSNRALAAACRMIERRYSEEYAGTAR